MKCPVCTEVSLSMTARQGIEIDYCPQCRGIWLDRGELDRLIERSDRTAVAPTMERPQDWNRHDDHSPRYGKRRKSLLGELFDF